jgi:hypothetical protein
MEEVMTSEKVAILRSSHALPSNCNKEDRQYLYPPNNINDYEYHGNNLSKCLVPSLPTTPIDAWQFVPAPHHNLDFVPASVSFAPSVVFISIFVPVLFCISSSFSKGK